MIHKLGIIPSVILGGIFAIVGAWFCNLLVNYTWLVPVGHPQFDPITRNTVLGIEKSENILQAADWTLIVMFLGGIGVFAMGVFMPIAYMINRRLHRLQPKPAGFLAILRQSFWWGIVAVVAVWLQINRSLWIPLILLVAGLFILLEGYLFARKTYLIQSNDPSPEISLTHPPQR